MAKALPAFMLKGREDDMAMASMQGGTEEALAEIEMQKELREKREKAKIWIKDLQKFYISPYLTCGKYNKFKVSYNKFKVSPFFFFFSLSQFFLLLIYLSNLINNAS